MTEFEMPEAALIRQLRERLGDEQADACVADFITYLSLLGEGTYRQAWDIVSRDAVPGTGDAEHVMSRAERRSKVYHGMAQALTAYLADAQPVPVADETPAWAQPTQVLMPLVPA
jgi:hypothetical protein